MAEVRIERFEESFVIHFGGDFARVNAYTLASTLVGLADAAKAANSVLNPGFEIEVVVETLGPGSFRARVATLFHSAANLFSVDSIKAIVLSVIASYVYQHTLAPDQEINVNVDDDEVVITQGDKKIVVPRAVHEATTEFQGSRQFKESVARVFEAMDSDASVSSVGFVTEMDEPAPEVPIPRDRFAALFSRTIVEEENSREIVQTTVLQITRAILERGRKRWQFVWRGVRISAPVTDDQFYNRFFAHEIVIAPGDALEARLHIRQRWDPELRSANQ